MLLRLATIALLAGTATAASASVLVDGGFEAAGAGVADYCYDGFAAGGNPACGPGAWGTAGGVIRSGSAAWGGTTTFDGNYFGMLQGGQVLSQTFVASATSQLSVDWLDTNRTNYGGLHSYTLTINGSSIGTYTSNTFGFVTNSSAAFNVVAGQSYTVAFNGIANGDTTTFIDRVTLAVVAVPEPASWAMMLVGFGLIGVAARRGNLVATV